MVGKNLSQNKSYMLMTAKTEKSERHPTKNWMRKVQLKQTLYLILAQPCPLPKNIGCHV